MKSVSCICPTFGRTSMLAEAVESFIRQKFSGKKELLVVNDLPEQKIIINHPEVRVINLDKRFSNLGEKRTFSYQQAKYPLLLTWGDDDIHLNNRIERAVNGLKNDRMILEGWHFCIENKEIKYNKFSTTGAHIVEKSLAEEVNWFCQKSTGEDADFNLRVLKVIGKLKSIQERPAFIYRWFGTDRPHISAYHTSDNSKDAYKIVGDAITNFILDKKEPIGEIEIIPRWDQDYELLINAVHPN